MENNVSCLEEHGKRSLVNCVEWLDWHRHRGSTNLFVIWTRSWEHHGLCEGSLTHFSLCWIPNRKWSLYFPWSFIPDCLSTVICMNSGNQIINIHGTSSSKCTNILITVFNLCMFHYSSMHWRTTSRVMSNCSGNNAEYYVLTLEPLQMGFEWGNG